MRAIIGFAVLTCTASGAAQAADYNTGPAAIISCPAKGKLARVIDLSTGGEAPWVVTGPGIPNGKARATPLDEAQISKDWAARLDGARWVQALPVNERAAHAPGTYLFSLSFDVKKGKRLPMLSLTGEVTADEAFDLNLIEPSGPNQHIASGLSYGDETPGQVAQEDVQPIDISKSGGLNGKPLGHRAGSYRLQISIENGAGAASDVGLLARVKLGVKCGGT